ncbi:putative membrane protein [Methanomicrobium sp. W14]|nr:putative membrane protein [Methanomicrobium sp. W14]
MSTMIFLTVTAALGYVPGSFLPLIIVRLLNVAVGVALILFGIRFLLKRDNSGATASLVH